MSEKKAEKLKIDPKTLLIDVLYDIIGMYTFAVSSNFAPGGVSGLAILVNYITGGKIPIGLCTVIINIPIILICIRTLGKLFFLRSVKTILISAVIVDYIMPLLPTYTGDPIHLYARFFNRRFRLCHSCNSQKESPAFNREHIPRC